VGRVLKDVEAKPGIVAKAKDLTKIAVPLCGLNSRIRGRHDPKKNR
jgi:hypothetical protein